VVAAHATLHACALARGNTLISPTEHSREQRLTQNTMTQPRATSAAAAPLAGLQTCEWSHLTIDTTTEPKEGGYGDVPPPARVFARTF